MWGRFRSSAIALSSVLLFGAQALADSSAQGVMVSLNDLSGLGVVSTNTYQFDPVAGAGYFSNAVTSVTRTCVGTLSNCSSLNLPIQPAAPPPDDAAPKNLASSVKCVFLDGGPLTATSTYEQTLPPVPGRNNLGSFTFTYHYTVSPAVSSVNPLTAWSLISTSGPSGKAAVTIQAKVASERAKRDDGKTKFSFDLKDRGKNRLSRLAILVNDVVVARPNSTIRTNCPGCKVGKPKAVDFSYTTNSGASGKISLLKNGDARTILNTDNAKNNDDGGRDGDDLELAIVDPVSLQLPVGNYTVAVTGRVNGVDTFLEQDFEVGNQVNVVGAGCSAAP